MRKKCILSISEILGRVPHPLPHPLHKCPRPPDLAPGEVDSQGHPVLADGDVPPHDQPVPDARHPHRGDQCQVRLHRRVRRHLGDHRLRRAVPQDVVLHPGQCCQEK